MKCLRTLAARRALFASALAAAVLCPAAARAQDPPHIEILQPGEDKKLKSITGPMDTIYVFVYVKFSSQVISTEYAELKDANGDTRGFDPTAASVNHVVHGQCYEYMLDFAEASYTNSTLTVRANISVIQDGMPGMEPVEVPVEGVDVAPED